MTTAYILRANGVGVKLNEEFEQIVGAKVYNGSTDKLPEADMVFRWGTTTTVPGNPKVINKLSAMEKTTDKRGFRLECAKNDLAPRSWGSFDELLENNPNGLDRSVLVRPAFHAKSQDMLLCTTLYEAKKAIQTVGKGYISEFIEKKQEFRVFIAQNRVVWVIEKFPENEEDLSWGCVQDGSFAYVGWSEWPMESVRVSLEAMKLSGLDFGAVDVMVDQTGKAYVCEINTAPYLTPYYRKAIGKVFRAIIENGRDHFPDVDYSVAAKDYWKSIIHPAIKDF